jgi:outer membrane protein assembly factor BamB
MELEAARPELRIRGGGSPFKENNRVVCLELRTGKVVWEYIPDRLNIAILELYKDGLFVQRSTPRGDFGAPLYLDAKTGKPIKEFKHDPGRLLTKSPIWDDDAPVVLANGWRMVPSLAQDMKTLRFLDPKSATEMWRIEIADSVGDIRTWKDFVFCTLDMFKTKGVLYAYRAGGKRPAWTVDLNKIVKESEPRLTRMFFQVLDDTLYVQAHEHVFAINPENGKLLWHRNVETDLRLESSDLYGPGNDWSTMAKDGNILIISYQCRVVALDLKAKKYLWHLEPDAYPTTPYPIAHEGKLYLSSGPKRKLKRLP